MNNKGMMMGAGTGGGMKMFSILFAFVLLVMGLIPLLNYFGVISFSMPPIPDIILNVVIVIGGILLLVDSFRMI